MKNKILGYVAEVHASRDAFAVNAVVQKVAQDVVHGRVVPDLESLSQLRRAVVDQFEIVSPSNTRRRHSQTGKLQSDTVAQIHELGVVANHLTIPLPPSALTTESGLQAG